MAYSSMRNAYRMWRTLNRRVEAAREALNHEYLALLHKAEEYQIAPQNGILGAAASILDHSQDPTLQLQARLHHAFALLGQGFFRRSPTSLQLDIFRLADQTQEICRQCHHLVAKLQIAQKVFDLVRHNQSVSKRYLNLALINPKGVWVSLLLQQRCLLTRQTIDLSLTHSWQTKLTICQRFLKLVQPLMPPKILRDFQKSLNDLEDQIASQPHSSPWSQAAQRRLDSCTELAFQVADEIISSQSGIK